LDKLQKGLEVNLKAAWLLNQQVVESLRARKAGGAIVNIGTRAARPLEGPPFPDTVVAQSGTLYGGTKAALHRFSQGVAAETYGQGISINVLSPLAAIATPNVVAGGWIPPEVCEPVETMVEATVALLIGDPLILTGLDVYSIELLHQLDRPVYDLAGKNLMEGWQPADLLAYIQGVRARR
jgi:NAD(P)-dependent dehydrogenase (short-subunit alcohol dehydrogenase family)